MNATATSGPLLLPIDRSRSFNPETFPGKGWSIWKGPSDGDGLAGVEEQNVQSLALPTVDFQTVLFEHTLTTEETSITGEEKLRRLKAAGRILLDAQIGKTLWEEPGHRTLKFLSAVYGIKWFDLPGTVLRSPGGNRFTLYFYLRGERLDLGYCWLGGRYRTSGPSAVLARPWTS